MSGSPEHGPLSPELEPPVKTSKIQRALAAMIEKAQELGLTRGVAAVCIYTEDDQVQATYWQPNGSIEREPRDPEDSGTNYLAVAMAKLSQMVSTKTHSGQAQRQPKFGENTYRGGLIESGGGYYYLVAYSGGAEDQDVEVANAGLAVLLTD